MWPYSESSVIMTKSIVTVMDVFWVQIFLVNYVVINSTLECRQTVKTPKTPRRANQIIEMDYCLLNLTGMTETLQAQVILYSLKKKQINPRESGCKAVFYFMDWFTNSVHMALKSRRVVKGFGSLKNIGSHQVIGGRHAKSGQKHVWRVQF